MQHALRYLKDILPRNVLENATSINYELIRKAFANYIILTIYIVCYNLKDINWFTI